MLADARNGNLNLIITKSISRFARNTILLLESVRELKVLSVGIIFEEAYIINRLYEDKVIGELSMERFATMLAGFEEEQAGLRAKCDDLRITIAIDREKTDSAERFIKVVRKHFTDILELTVEIVTTLIKNVLIYQAEKINGQKVQKVRSSIIS